jgi:hypothetical protein
VHQRGLQRGTGGDGGSRVRASVRGEHKRNIRLTPDPESSRESRHGPLRETVPLPI